MIKKLFMSKEIKIAFSTLEEVSNQLNNDAFQIVRKYIEDIILARSEEISNHIRSGKNIHNWILSVTGNIAGDLLESGQYHIYRGVLNPVGPGEDLLKLFYSSLEELVKLDVIDVERAEIERQAILNNIMNVG